MIKTNAAESTLIGTVLCFKSDHKVEKSTYFPNFAFSSMFAMRKNKNLKINFCIGTRYPYDTDFKECCQEDVIGENGEPSNLFNLVRSDECAEIGGTVVVSG